LLTATCAKGGFLPRAMSRQDCEGYWHAHLRCARYASVGTLDLSPQLGSSAHILCAAVCPRDGTRFLCTGSAVWALSPAGRMAVVAGHESERGFEDGVGEDVRFNCPRGITVCPDGGVLLADTWNNAIRKVLIAVASPPSARAPALPHIVT
jgi:hypothetical protein